MSQIEQAAWISLASIFAPTLLSVVIASLISLYKIKIEPTLPKNIQDFLTTEATRVVNAIEKMSTSNDPQVDISARKDEALKDLAAIFKAHGLPVPPEVVLSDAIEAAVNFLPRTGLMGNNTPIPAALAAQAHVFIDPSPTMMRPAITDATTNPALGVTASTTTTTAPANITIPDAAFGGVPAGSQVA